MLNPLKNEIMCVRGNCDTEVDQMVLDFNVLCEQACMYVNDKSLVMVHGHKLDEKNMPAIKDGDYLVCGHTHIPKCEKREGYTYIIRVQCQYLRKTAHIVILFWKISFTGKTLMEMCICRNSNYNDTYSAIYKAILSGAIFYR